MSHRLVSHRVKVYTTSPLVIATALSLGACGSDQNGATGTVNPSTSSSDSTNTGGQSSTGTGNNTSTGNTSTGPTGSSSGGSSTGASGTSGGSGSQTTGPSGSSGASGSSSTSDAETSGTSDTAGGPSGTETSSPASDTTSGSGSSDETSGTPGACTREFLDGILSDYLAALSAGDASSLPLSTNFKFTENAEEVEIGSTDFWMNAGDPKHVQAALDTTQCSVAAQAVVPEGTTDLPIGLRIKVEAGEITEIETIVVRQGDYTASFAVDSKPADIITISDQVGWHEEVAEADRATREQLSSWVEKYFRAFPEGVCSVTPECRRLENGGGNDPGQIGFSCQAGASCSDSDTSTNGFEPRVIVVDEVRGIAAGFTMFDAFGTSGHLDMHMMKMYGGEVHAVHAILRDTQGQSGWE